MELFRALGALAEVPAPEHRTIAEALGLGPPPSAEEHAACFLFRFPRYASVVLGPEGMLGGVARDRIAGFWRALGIEPPPEPDDAVILLASYARLAELESGEPEGARRLALRRARRAFLHEHLLSWLPLVATRMLDLAPPFYREWAAMLLGVLSEEAEASPDGEALPAHLREAPALPDHEPEGAEELLTWLLAPVRSGMLLVRDDLARAADAVEQAVRPGERRTMLRSLLAEDPAGMLGWLAGEARRQSVQHRTLPGRRSAAWWSDRAAGTSQRLDDLARRAEDVIAEERALPTAR